MQRAASLSSASSFSSVSDQNVDTDIDSQTTASSKSSEPKRTRKRFSQEQLIVLEQAYHKSTHPTREEREEIAKQADMNFKSVTIWFQNKRQAERKMALNKPSDRNAPSPFATYPADSSALTGRTSLAPSHASTVLSKSQPTSLIPARTASGFISLDRIASRTERTPRTPTKLTRHSSFIEPRSNTSEDLWESMLSSPIQPEKEDNTRSTPSDSPSARDYLDFASVRGSHGSRLRGRRTLEWACAAARVSVDKKDEPSDMLERNDRLPALSFDVVNEITLVDDDASTEIVDTEMESIEDSFEAITPDSSQIMFADHPSPTLKPGQLLDLKATAPERKKLSSQAEIKLEDEDHDTEKDSEVLDAAWALCGLSMMRR